MKICPSSTFLCLVSCMQPAIRVNHLRGGLVVVPVAHHDAGTAHQQFILLTELYLGATNGDTNTGGDVVFQRIDADHRAGFRQTITLHDRYTQADEHPGDIRRQGRTATHCSTQTPAQFFNHIAGHQLVEQGPQHELRRPARTSLLILETVPAHIHRCVEQLARNGRLLFQLILDLAVDPFKYPRYCDEHRWTDVQQIIPQLRHGARIGHAGARHEGR